MDMFVGIHLDLWWTFPGHKKITWRKKKGNLGKQSTQFSTWDNTDSYIAAILGALCYTARVSVSHRFAAMMAFGHRVGQLDTFQNSMWWYQLAQLKGFVIVVLVLLLYRNM